MHHFSAVVKREYLSITSLATWLSSLPFSSSIVPKAIPANIYIISENMDRYLFQGTSRASACHEAERRVNNAANLQRERSVGKADFTSAFMVATDGLWR